MPRQGPPARKPGTPVLRKLASGTRLFRMHSDEFDSLTFNPTVASHPLRGGRFDSDDGAYSYLYAGEDFETVIAEALVRDLPSGPIPPRLIPRVQLARKVLSELVLGQSLQVVSLIGADLGHVGQDAWLTKCAASDYALTRRWAAAIRAWAPKAAGFVWRSYRDEERDAYVLFGDRVPRGALGHVSSIAADSGRGLLLVKRVLQAHNAGVG